MKKVEKINFGFVWIGSKSDKERGIDRIKRAVFKNGYDSGVLNMTDMDCLNRSLKLKQFVRANGVNHTKKAIQKYCIEKLGHTNTVVKEY